jgi:hypothetical protein
VISLMSGKFKKIRPYEDDIMHDYLEEEMNMSQIAEKYNMHYSNVRRFIKHKIKEMGLEESLSVEYVNVEDFRYLDIGDTFCFAEWLTIWRVNKIVEKENELLYELVPATNPNPRRHWICGENTPDDDYEVPHEV